MDATANQSLYSVARPASSLARVNRVNSGLMVLSCLLAYVVPLELFLFSYAVLGPLHYLTQISWLQKRDFFVKRKVDYLFLIALSLIIAAITVFGIRAPISLFVGIAFGGALAVTFLEKTVHKIVAVILISAVAVLTSRLTAYSVLFGMFLPSVVHVCIFTGLFILYGALKSRSRSAYVSLFVFIGCSLLFFIISPTLFGITDSAYFRGSYRPFERLNFYLAKLLGFSDIGKLSDIYVTESGVALMRFLAFAYTYHYLNWFSKTSILNWHKISPLRWGAVLGLWILSVAVYAIDYRIGFIVLFSLGMAHVLLEFPLDHRTFWGIWNEIHKRVTSRAKLSDQSTVSG